MPLFGVNPAAEEGLAAVGAVLRSIQIIPQIVKSYRTKSTHGLSSAFMLAWACTQLALGPYTIVQQFAIPLQIQPQAFAFFSAVSWAQCLHYGREMPISHAAVCFVALLAVLAGAQVGSVFGLRAGRAAGTEVPVQVFGYLTWLRTFLSAPPQFYKIYQLREVVGFSYIFMSIDIVGAIFSILSLLFRPKADIPAIVTFALVVVQNGLVILLALILNPRARARRAKEGDLVFETPSASPSPNTPAARPRDEEAAIEDRYRSMQAHKGSVASDMTLIATGDKYQEEKKDWSRTSTVQVTESEAKGPLSVNEPCSAPSSGAVTPMGGNSNTGGYGRSRASTLVDLPELAQLKEVDSHNER